MGDGERGADPLAGAVRPDQARASVARMYDYFVGGKENYAADRQAAEQVLYLVPDLQEIVQANRDFMTAAVRGMARSGIEQFLDLGAGFPTTPSAHEVAREIRPSAVVAYVDKDPTVSAHNRALLAGRPGILAVHGDLCQPGEILGNPQVLDGFDLSRPVGVLLVAVLHFVSVAAAPEIVAGYLRALPAGSQVAISTAVRDGVPEEVVRQIGRIYDGTNFPFVHRTRAEVEQLFAGLDLLPPGVIDVYHWSGRAPAAAPTLREDAAIARKP